MYWNRWNVYILNGDMMGLISRIFSILCIETVNILVKNGNINATFFNDFYQDFYNNRLRLKSYF